MALYSKYALRTATALHWLPWAGPRATSEAPLVLEAMKFHTIPLEYHVY
jgi:hypothetical protein